MNVRPTVGKPFRPLTFGMLIEVQDIAGVVRIREGAHAMVWLVRIRVETFQALPVQRGLGGIPIRWTAKWLFALWREVGYLRT